MATGVKAMEAKMYLKAEYPKGSICWRARLFKGKETPQIKEAVRSNKIDLALSDIYKIFCNDN
jgi:hypothetical protein